MGMPGLLNFAPSPPLLSSQDFNVLRYSPGQHYNSHMDTFDPHYLTHSNPGFGQRMATFLMYLSDVEEGGETVFKHEGKYGEYSNLALACGANRQFSKQPYRPGWQLGLWPW